MHPRHRSLRTVTVSTILFLGVTASARDVSITSPVNEPARRARYGPPIALVTNITALRTFVRRDPPIEARVR